jgi:hypothetical protein
MHPWNDSGLLRFARNDDEQGCRVGKGAMAMSLTGREGRRAVPTAMVQECRWKVGTLRFAHPTK